MDGADWESAKKRRGLAALLSSLLLGCLLLSSLFLGCLFLSSLFLGCLLLSSLFLSSLFLGCFLLGCLLLGRFFLCSLFLGCFLLLSHVFPPRKWKTMERHCDLRGNVPRQATGHGSPCVSKCQTTSKSVIQPSSQHSFDVNLRYLYALRQIPQHVFGKIMLASQSGFVTSPSSCVKQTFA